MIGKNISSTAPTTDPEPPSRTIRLLRLAGTALIGAAAALAAIGVVPGPQQQIGPASVEAGVALGAARTDLRVPPLGIVSAKTHSGPLIVTLTVTEIDVSRLPALLLEPARRDAFVKTARQGLEDTARMFALRLLISALLAGAAASAILPGRDLLHITAGAAAGLISVAVVLAVTAESYRPQAFEQPRFTGSLERAPQVISAVQKQAGSLDALQSRFQEAASRLSRLLLVIDAPLEDPQNDTTAILHVSDIHSNPLGVEMAKRLAERFKVKAIIDTGDLTSFGEPIEARIGQLLATMPAPYVFVPGNHDSPAIRAGLATIPNVVVLDEATHDVAGLTILGWGDPSFTASNEVTLPEQEKALEREGRRVAGAARRLNPDVLAVHHRKLAARLRGEVPLVLAGHAHRRSTSGQPGSLLLQVGSTGATGLGSFLVESDLPYEAQILYFKDGMLTAYDYISLHGLGAEFQISRTAVGVVVP